MTIDNNPGIKFGVALPPDLHRIAKMLAAASNRTLRQLVIDALANYIGQPNNQRALNGAGLAPLPDDELIQSVPKKT